MNLSFVWRNPHDKELWGIPGSQDFPSLFSEKSMGWQAHEASSLFFLLHTWSQPPLDSLSHGWTMIWENDLPRGHLSCEIIIIVFLKCFYRAGCQNATRGSYDMYSGLLY